MTNYRIQSKRTYTGGFIVILNTVLFLAVSFVMIYAVTVPLISSNRASTELLQSKKAFVVAGSATEEVLYKMKNQMDVDSSEVLTLDGTSAEISVADTYDGRLINVSATEDDVVRNVRVGIVESVGTSFNYGIQVGQGGFEISGGAVVHGNVYANGSILGNGGAIITGSATAANGSEPSVVATNGDGTPETELIFGGQLVWNDKKPEDIAQSFTVATTTPITSVRLYIKKYANVWMNNGTVRITNSTSGHPGRTTIASGNLSASQVTTSFNYLTIPFSNPPSLTPGTTYWIVIDTKNTWDSYYVLGATNGEYADGSAMLGEWSQGGAGGTWNASSPTSLDAFFTLYAGGETGLITGVNIGSAGGDAWAHEVNDSNVSGTIYCQASSGNNKACNTSRPDPAQQPYPISDGNIEAWKLEAEAGGIHEGDLVVGPWPMQTLTLGPQKIEGDLRVTSGGTLTVSGTLYVTGDIILNGGGTIQLSTSYGNTSGVIVSDGRIVATGGGKFKDNGLSESYILIVTTSSCPEGACGGDPAIEASGGSDAVIFNAQNGTMEITGGAELKQATAKTLIMSGGSDIYYESGLADMNFSSGPSGGWSITSWDEI